MGCVCKMFLLVGNMLLKILKIMVLKPSGIDGKRMLELDGILRAFSAPSTPSPI